MLRKARFAIVSALFVALHLWAAVGIDPNRYLEDVKYLASPELKGRGTGAEGLEKAADFLAKRFKEAHLQPLERSYFQRFPVTANAKLGPGNRFEVIENGRKKTLQSGRDFQPFNFSSSGKFAGRLVFAGYGITAPEYGYDDYAGVDVKGKVVIVLRNEPQEGDENSVFAGRLYTEHAQFWSKAVNAKRRGAAGVVLVNNRHGAGYADLEKFGRAAGPAEVGIPFIQVKREIVEGWISAAGKNLAELEAAIDKELKPQTFALPDSLEVSAVADLKREIKTVRNVWGFLPGEADEYVIVGAHYDHVGLGEQYSMAPSEVGRVHPGADDNASGTAGVIELARWFASQPKLKRGILFVAFAGEELGLLGSRYYVDHPPLPLEKAVAMINLDMIGRLRDSKVFIGGARTGTTFQALLEKELAKHHLKLDLSGGMEAGSSDHASFTSRQVPVLFFFSGLHGDYHRPSDTWDKIAVPEAAELLRAVADVTKALAEDEQRPEFVRVEAPQTGPVAGGGSGYGAWFGSVPDFGETPEGVRFADVTAGSPAAKAGLRAGDILVEFDGAPVQNLYDFTYALRAKKPGEEVTVKVLRGTETITAKVTLGERQR